MSLREKIQNWNEKSVQDLGAIYDKYGQSQDFADKLIAYCEITQLQKGATWLLKKICEDHGQLTEKQILSFYALLTQYEHWEAKLHVLQIIPYLPIPFSAKKEVELFLRTCLEQNEKFVRAWSYNGFFELARQYPEYQEEVKLFFDMALRDECASVKARIRNIMKKGF